MNSSEWNAIILSTCQILAFDPVRLRLKLIEIDQNWPKNDRVWDLLRCKHFLHSNFTIMLFTRYYDLSWPYTLSYQLLAIAPPPYKNSPDPNIPPSTHIIFAQSIELFSSPLDFKNIRFPNASFRIQNCCELEKSMHQPGDWIHTQTHTFQIRSRFT